MDLDAPGSDRVAAGVEQHRHAGPYQRGKPRIEGLRIRSRFPAEMQQGDAAAALCRLLRPGSNLQHGFAEPREIARKQKVDRARWRSRFVQAGPVGQQPQKASEQRPVILHDLRVKHRRLLRPAALVERERRELPRFALFAADAAETVFATDLAAACRRSQPRAAAHAAFVRAMVTGGRTFFPDFAVFGTLGAIRRLQQAGVLHCALWQAERELGQVNFVGVAIDEAEPDTRSVTVLERETARSRLASCPLVLTTRFLLEQIIRDRCDEWIRSLLSDPQPLVGVVQVRVPPVDELPVEPAAVGYMLAEVSALRTLWHRREHLDARWRGKRWRPAPHCIARDLAESGPLYPCLPRRDRPQIAFVVPTASVGGVERVVMNCAGVCRQRGFGTHLVVTGTDDALLPPPFDQAFNSVAFAGTAATGGWQPERAYFGAHPSAWATGGDQRDLRGLLIGMDVVFNTHAVDVHAIASDLRRAGVLMLLGLHLVELDGFGRPMGNSHLALAYEHAYDHFVVISRELEDWCIGQGIPASKLLRVENAPAYPADPAVVQQALAEKAKRGDRPLNLLFLGRLDPQKGIDRLEDIIRRTTLTDRPVEWRVVGREVLGGEQLTCAAVRALREPPATSAQELDRLYAWADVLVVPFRFEGVPLTVLEAQRMGCVVIAADVGAVAECIEDGVDGLLVRDRGDEQVVDTFCRLVQALDADRARLARLREAAARRAAGRSWSRHLEPLLAVLDQRFGASEPAERP